MRERTGAITMPTIDGWAPYSSRARKTVRGWWDRGVERMGSGRMKVEDSALQKQGGKDSAPDSVG